MRYTDSFNDDEDDFDFDEADAADAEMAEVIAESNRNREEQLRLTEKQMRSDLLDKAILVSRSSWFWGFYPNSVKLAKIAETYDVFEKLLGD